MSNVEKTLCHTRRPGNGSGPVFEIRTALTNADGSVWSQKQLAKEVGCTRVTINHCEKLGIMPKSKAVQTNLGRLRGTVPNASEVTGTITIAPGEQVRAAVETAREGRSIEAVASEWGVCPKLLTGYMESGVMVHLDSAANTVLDRLKQANLAQKNDCL